MSRPKRDCIRGYMGRVEGFTRGTTELTILFEGTPDLCPPDLMYRRITVIIEPTPGEAAYIRHHEQLGLPAYDRWEALSDGKRYQWERTAEAAIKAKPVR